MEYDLAGPIYAVPCAKRIEGAHIVLCREVGYAYGYDMFIGTF